MKAKKILFISLSLSIFFILITATSCSIFGSKPTGTLSADWKNGSGDRSVYPFDASLANVSCYRVTFYGPDNFIESIDDITETIIEKPYLPIGEWRIEVVALNTNDQVLGRGTITTEVKPSSTTKVSIKVMPSGEGLLSLVLDWTENPLVTEALTLTADILPDGLHEYLPIVLLRESNTASYQAKLNSGTYNIVVKLVDANSRVVWGKLETFHLYEDLDTSTTIGILPEQMNAPPELAPQIRSADRGHNGLVIGWDEGSGRTESYIIERKTANETWSEVARLSYNVLQFSDVNLQPATSYFYRLRAENYFGTSAWSEEIEIRTLPLKEVGGLLKESAVWSSDTVYKVTSNMKIPSGMKLTIQPGTKVMINSGLYIQVDGEMVAKGLPESPILLGYDSSGWSYVNFTDGSVDARYVNGQYESGSIMQYVMVRGGGRLGFDRAKPYLDHLDIKDWSGGPGIRITLDNDYSYGFKIENSIFQSFGSDWALYFSGDGRAEINGNLIKGYQGIYFENGNNKSGTLIINNEVFTNYTGLSIDNGYASESNPIKIKNNKFSSVISGGERSGTAIYLGWSEQRNILLEGNIITRKNCALQINTYRLGHVYIKGNSISDCEIGFHYTGYNPIEYPVVEFSENSLIDSTITGQYFNFYEMNKSNMLNSSKNYFDNRSASYEVQLGDGLKVQDTTVLDLSGNYWYTNDTEAIQTRIYDAARDFAYGKVEINPIAVLDGLKVLSISPTDGAVWKDSLVQLSWMAMGRAAKYELQVAKEEQFLDLIVSKNGIVKTTWNLAADGLPVGLEDGKRYYWRVKGEDLNGAISAWSEIRSFEIRMETPLPTLPIDKDVLYDDFSPRFTWEPQNLASAYRLILDDDESFISPLANVVVEGSTEYELTNNLAPDKMYYWKVYGIDAKGLQGKIPSAVQSFRIPKPGLTTQFINNLPKIVELTINGQVTIDKYQVPNYSVTSNIVPEKIKWFINAVEQVESSVFQWPSKSKGIYSLTAMVFYQGRWYSKTVKIQVLESGEAMP